MSANCISSSLYWGGPYSVIEWHQPAECYHGQAHDNDIRSIPLPSGYFCSDLRFEQSLKLASSPLADSRVRTVGPDGVIPCVSYLCSMISSLILSNCHCKRCVDCAKANPPLHLKPSSGYYGLLRRIIWKKSWICGCLFIRQRKESVLNFGAIRTLFIYTDFTVSETAGTR